MESHSNTRFTHPPFAPALLCYSLSLWHHMRTLLFSLLLLLVLIYFSFRSNFWLLSFCVFNYAVFNLRKPRMFHWVPPEFHVLNHNSVLAITLFKYWARTVPEIIICLVHYFSIYIHTETRGEEFLATKPTIFLPLHGIHDSVISPITTDTTFYLGPHFSLQLQRHFVYVFLTPLLHCLAAIFYPTPRRLRRRLAPSPPASRHTPSLPTFGPSGDYLPTLLLDADRSARRAGPCVALMLGIQSEPHFSLIGTGPCTVIRLQQVFETSEGRRWTLAASIPAP